MSGSCAEGPYDDPSAAPSAYTGENAASPWTFRRGLQNWLWIYVAGLMFLVFAFASILEHADSPVAVAVQIVLVALVGLAYVLTPWIADSPLVVRWLYLLGFVALLALFAPWWGWEFLNFGVYVSVMLATLIPWRVARIGLLVWNLLLGAIALLTVDVVPLIIALLGVVVGFATGTGMEAGRVASRLRRAEQRVSALTLAAERERISRDLHDILGHSLTAITIKADLAGRLVDRDPAAARAEIAQVSEIARQSLADVRATASGMREVRVATEVASARAVLLAAGIDASVPTAIEPMSDQTSELFGYVIREAVTNAVRHSEARRCVITVDARSVSLTDDGVGIGEHPNGGSGLAGLRSRLEAAGGRFRVGPGPDGGTRVEAAL